MKNETVLNQLETVESSPAVVEGTSQSDQDTKLDLIFNHRNTNIVKIQNLMQVLQQLAVGLEAADAAVLIMCVEHRGDLKRLQTREVSQQLDMHMSVAYTNAVKAIGRDVIAELAALEVPLPEETIALFEDDEL